MEARISGKERRTCPPEFQERVNEVFGFNRFGGPMFKIVWGQTERAMRSSLDGHGYEERLVCSGVPCWNIMRWIPPESFGSPETYYELTYDQATGLHDLGEYPWEGRYEVLQPLMHRSFNDDKTVMKVDALPLTYRIIDLLIPVLTRARRVSYWEAKAAEDEMQRRENTAIVGQITDRMIDAMPAFIGPHSARGQVVKNNSFQKRMEAVEQSWKQYGKRNWKKGFGQGRN